MLTIRLLISLLVGGSTFVLPLGAQVVTATLTGTVKDSSGAGVPNAKIRVINTATNIDRSTVADSEGGYSLPALSPGEYRVEVEASGFKRSNLSGIVLQVAQQARVDVALEVGQVTENVTVAASTLRLETESQQIGGVINERRILELPLNGRNFMELVTLTAGTHEGSSTTAKAGILNKGYAPSVAGMPATENNYQMDGADNREAFFNTYNIAPTVDAVREFRIQVGQYSAEFGAGGGAVINVVTKSGTNELHGAAWEFIRNDYFDARNFFLTPSQNIASLRRNQFGAAGGAPIIKDRTFFFGSFEMTRVRQGSLRTSFVPNAAQKGGNLSAFTSQLIDPLNRQPLAGNLIPATRINPISAGLAKYYPEPNSTGNPSVNYINNLPRVDDLDSYLIRLDHRLSQKHDLMARWSSQFVDRFTPGPYANVGGQLQPQHFLGAVAGATSTLTPTLLNEFRFNYSRTLNRRRAQNTGSGIAADLGIPFATRDPLAGGFPQSIGIGRSLVSGIGEDQPWFLTVNSFQWYDGITWVKGAHTLKAGADLRRNRADQIALTHSNGNYTFSGQFSNDGFADFLLGHPGSSLLMLKPNDPARFRRFAMAYYVTDDWKVTSKLTLNIGLRYEFSSIPRELLGLTPSFDLKLGNGVGGLLFPKQNTSAAEFYARSRPDLPVAKLDRDTMFRPDRNNLAPRFGFAWRPFSNNATVIRGGYGFYYSSAQLINLVQNSISGPPAAQIPTYTSDPTTPTLTYGGRVGESIEQAFRSATFGVLTGPQQDWLDAYTQQWSLSVGREIGKAVTLEVQYLGSKSTHVENLWDYNYAQPSPAALQPRLPNPAWGRIQGFSSGADANYHALMVTAERRMSQGLLFKGAYTFGKALTRGGGRIAAGNIGQAQNPGNLDAESGRTTDDVNHRFTGNFVWELPFGAGRRFGSNAGKVPNALLGGWNLAGVITARTGLYLTPGIAGANCNSSNANPCRPDLIGNAKAGGNGVTAPRWNRAAFDWPLNPAHARQDPRFGTASPNSLLSNGIHNWDASIHKVFSFAERFRLELRLESFNALNHTNFGAPVSGPDNPNFGRVFGTATDPRVNQIGLKFYW